MAAASRREIEQAFARFQEVAAESARRGDWNAWADLFTEDAEYLEHHFGRFHGREEIRRWITSTMSEAPNTSMTSFPVDWYVIDEDRGWVVCAVWNRMEDPGDGGLHQAINWTLIKYAGDGRWSYEEDIYNPLEFGQMMKGWAEAGRAAKA